MTALRWMRPGGCVAVRNSSTTFKNATRGLVTRRRFLSAIRGNCSGTITAEAWV
jgi:hypothetical protein